MQKIRFSFLDGIRGIAAILVLTRHTEIFWKFSIYRSYLAVDLFFILSGFVIAYAYDEKLQTKIISFPQFVLIRLIRLYPVFFISLILCTVNILLSRHSADQIKLKNNGELFELIACTALFIPLKIDGRTNLFPINAPYWSLFFELISNVLYAVLRPVLSSSVLIGIVILFGGIISIGAISHGNLDIGVQWGMKSNIAGFARSVFGIFMGLLLYRHHKYLLFSFDRRETPWIAFFVLIAAMLIPDAGRFNPLVDIFAVTLLFPLCVLVASRGTMENKNIASILVGLGSASYPIYVLHKPVGEIIARLITKGGGDEIKYAPFSGFVLVVFLIALSIFIERRIDMPFRRWITSKVFKPVKPLQINPVEKTSELATSSVK